MGEGKKSRLSISQDMIYLHIHIVLISGDRLESLKICIFLRSQKRLRIKYLWFMNILLSGCKYVPYMFHATIKPNRIAGGGRQVEPCDAKFSEKCRWSHHKTLLLEPNIPI